MDPGRRPPGAFSPTFFSSSPPSPDHRDRSTSVDSDSSSVASSHVGVGATGGGPSVKRGPTPTATAAPSSTSRGATPANTTTTSIYASPRSNSSTPVLQNYSRPTITHVVGASDGGSSSSSTSLGLQGPPAPLQGVPGPGRRNLPINPSLINVDRSHKRHNSQGFFEPSLPTLTDSPVAMTPSANLGPGMATGGAGAGGGGGGNGGGGNGSLTPSQIAAQAAMQSQMAAGNGGANAGAPGSHFRKRSQTIPSPPPVLDGNGGGRSKVPPQSSQASQSPAPMLHPGSRKNSASAASTLSSGTGVVGPPGAAAAGAASAAYNISGQLSPGLTSFSEAPAERVPRSKAERAKQIFSKSKQITVPNPKEFERKDRPGPLTAKMPSPGTAIYPNKSLNASVTSLNDTLPGSSNTSIYGMANSSTSTLVPIERMKSEEQQQPKEQQTKEKEKEKEKSHRTNIFSRPKKNKDRIEDYPLALSSASSNSKPVDPSAPQSIYSFAQSSPAPSQTTFGKTVTGLGHGGRKKKEEFDFGSTFGQSSTATGHFVGGTPIGYESASSALQGFGLNNMSSEDAWDFLKAKILVIFEGEELKIPVEDLNRLVSVHIQRCVQRRSPVIIEDFRELLNTGFTSLDMTLRRLQDDRLVPRLVDMWLFVFGKLLPYMQSVFLPIDLELRGHGTMSPGDAAEFWGLPDVDAGGEETDVRKCVLLSFRDNVVLPRHDGLKHVFSRLSLESINVGLDSPLPPPPSFGSGSGSGSSFGGRPGTAGSLDPGQSSFNSQGSTLISDSSRSRATSNTSAPELPTFSPTTANRPAGGAGAAAGTTVTGQQQQQGLQGGGGAYNNYHHHHQQPDSSQVTETVGRVLQCMSVLVSLHSDDDAQAMMEDLTKTLKLNWLGRGRTGRNRKGLVGARVPRRATPVIG